MGVNGNSKILNTSRTTIIAETIENQELRILSKLYITYNFILDWLRLIWVHLVHFIKFPMLRHLKCYSSQSSEMISAKRYEDTGNHFNTRYCFSCF